MRNRAPLNNPPATPAQPATAPARNTLWSLSARKLQGLLLVLLSIGLALQWKLNQQKASPYFQDPDTFDYAPIPADVAHIPVTIDPGMPIASMQVALQMKNVIQTQLPLLFSFHVLDWLNKNRLFPAIELVSSIPENNGRINFGKYDFISEYVDRMRLSITDNEKMMIVYLLDEISHAINSAANRHRISHSALYKGYPVIDKKGASVDLLIDRYVDCVKEMMRNIHYLNYLSNVDPSKIVQVEKIDLARANKALENYQPLYSKENYPENATPLQMFSVDINWHTEKFVQGYFDVPGNSMAPYIEYVSMVMHFFTYFQLIAPQYCQYMTEYAGLEKNICTIPRATPKPS